MLREFSLYFLAAFFEILGCFCFWSFFRLDKSGWFLGLGALSLAAFAYALTNISLEFAGRAYAVYGGIYIVSSLLWLYLVEKQAISKWDALGCAVRIIGACLILFGAQKVG